VSDSDISDTLTENDDTQGNLDGYTLFVGALRHYETYSTSGALLSVIDDNGQGITLTYSTSSTSANIAPKAGLLLTVTDAKGRQLNFQYSTSGYLYRVTLPDGGTLTYSQDTSGNLAAVQYPDGTTRQYVYNESTLTGGNNLPNAMTGVVDEAGIRYESTTYGLQYLNGAQTVQGPIATASTFAGGVGTIQTVLGAANGSATVTYPLGLTSTLTFGMANGRAYEASTSAACAPQCGKHSWQNITYDSNGNPSTFTDFRGYVTSTLYDTNGLLDQEVAASGTTNQVTTTTQWNTSLRLPVSRVVVNASGTTIQSTQWAYSTAGQLLARCEIDPTNTAASAYGCGSTGSVPAGVRRWTYTYCASVDGVQCPLVGLLLTATGPRTDVSQTATYGYYLSSSAVGCGTPGAACYQAGDLHTITDALGHVTTIASYDADGHITRITDPNGDNVDFTYNARGWITLRVQNGAAIAFTYTPYGAVQSVTDADGVTTTYTYDAAHRLTKITDALGNYIQYTLDAAGNKTGEQIYDASGALHESLTRTFNTLGQLTTMVDGLGQKVFDASARGNYDANANLVKSADGFGIQRQRNYDGLNRLVETIDNYNGSDPSTFNTTLQYTYDGLGHVTQFTDPASLSTSHSYDGLGNATNQSSPDTGATTRTFDAAGNTLTTTDADGITTTYTYDALNRPLNVSYPDATQNIAYRYDEANSVTGCSQSYPVGHLTRMVEHTVSTVYCYDIQGRLTEKHQTIVNVRKDSIAYAYTAAGRLSTVLYPTGTLVSYNRDGDGRIQAISVTPWHSSAHTVVSAVTYEPFGPVNAYALGNGQTVTRTFDDNYRVTDVTSPAFNLHVALDAMGDIVALGNAAGANPATETYSYDPLYRLTQISDANGNALESVSYLAAGDRESKDGSGLATGGYAYSPGSHQLTYTGSDPRTADADGNTTAITEAGIVYGFGYNDRERLIIAQRAGVTVGSYTYNAKSERVAKTGDGISTRFVYNEQGQLVGEYGAAIRDYIWLGDIPVANLDTTSSGRSFTYVVADQLDTPRAITDSSGATVWQWPYQSNAWGEAAVVSSGYQYNLRFPGQYYDAETGLYYNINRYYDPTTGRYIQSDPLGVLAGPSTYSYVANNPLEDKDPSGAFLFPGQPPVRVVGGTADEQVQVQAALDQVWSTPRGQQMLDQIDGPWYEYGNPQELDINDYGDDEYNPELGVLWINEDANVYIPVAGGRARASLARIIAHELGHAVFGTKDDGPCMMNNVNQNENPVAKALGQPLRTAYRG
jgi:RHS repeat-associated protein